MTKKPIPTVATPWLDAARAAARAGVSTKTISRACQSGRLRFIRLNGGQRLRFKDDWVDAWLLGEAPDGESGDRDERSPLSPRQFPSDGPRVARKGAGTVKVSDTSWMER